MTQTISSPAAQSRYLTGACFGVATILIWAGWMSITRIGIATALTAADITMLRYGTAGILLLPVVLRHGMGLGRLRRWQLAVLVGGAGAPYAMVASSGLRYAPAADAGVLIPGVMPLFVAILSVLLLGEKIVASRKVGYGLILLGVLAIAGMAVLLPGSGRTPGHLLFLTASFMWASYTVVLRRSGLAPLHAAAIVSVWSAILFLPVYLWLRGPALLDIPLGDSALQAIFQGVLATIMSLYLFGKTIELLGASGGAAFGALVPALAALLAIPVLGEHPSLTDWLGIAAVTAGVYLASGGPVWRLTPRS